MIDQASESNPKITETANEAQPADGVNSSTLSEWITSLCDPSLRDKALILLGKKRELIADLAVMLWYSFGSVAALLEEVVSVYPSIMPPTLTAQQSNRVCNALALLQCIASHPDTRHDFMQARIPLFLYPFLHTSCKTRPFEYLRLTSLGVIGALVKTDEREVIAFLINTEIIPLCLRIMEHGSELSRTVATFILQKVLADDSGLHYICHTYERFSHVAMILGRMVLMLSKEPSSRLLKHVIRCYLRLSENLRAREALRSCLPDSLRNTTFAECLAGEPQTRRWLQQLIQNLEFVQNSRLSPMHQSGALFAHHRQILNGNSVSSTHAFRIPFIGTACSSGDISCGPTQQAVSNRALLSGFSSLSSNPYAPGMQTTLQQQNLLYRQQQVAAAVASNSTEQSHFAGSASSPHSMRTTVTPTGNVHSATAYPQLSSLFSASLQVPSGAGTKGPHQLNGVELSQQIH